MNTKTASLLIGLIFIAVGLLGFINNPIIGDNPDAIFHADKTHNIIHLASGLLFILFSAGSAVAAAGFLKLFGIIYLGLGIWGLIEAGESGMTSLLGFLHVNENDNYLHIGLGTIILLAGFLPQNRKVTA